MFEMAAYIYIYTEKGTNEKQQLPFVCSKGKTKTANFRLFAAKRNGQQKFVLLGQQNKGLAELISGTPTTEKYK